jgi:hypothetical protein
MTIPSWVAPLLMGWFVIGLIACVMFTRLCAINPREDDNG